MKNNPLEHAKAFIGTEAILPNKSKVKIKNIGQDSSGIIIAYFGDNGIINFSLLRDIETKNYLEDKDLA